MRIKFKWIYSLIFFIITTLTWSQNKNISGTVTDDKGKPISNVLVTVEETGNIATTDANGNYTIDAAQGQTLMFDNNGTINRQLVGVSNVLNSQLGDSQQLEEVVVNVLGIQVPKNQLASSYSKVGGDEVVNSGEKSILQGLSAKASGVQIVTNSGDPGSGAYFQIRGQNTITGNTQPLIVIDGVPVSNESFSTNIDGTLTSNQVNGVSQQSRLGDINPNDIADIQILKGASASALWGYRAANGVVLITTKKGKVGKLGLDFSSTFSFDKVNKKYSTQDIFGQGSNGIWSGIDSSSWGDKISDRVGGSDTFNTTGGKFVAEDGTEYFPITSKNSRSNFNDSNYDGIVGNGFSFENHIGLTGGNQNANYYLSFGRLEQNGVIRNSDYNRTTVNFKSTVKIDDKASVTGKFTYSNSNSARVQSGSNLSGLMLGLLRSPADFDNTNYIGTKFLADGTPLFNSQRSYRRQGGTNFKQSPGYNNPYWTTNIQKNPSTVNRFIAGIEAKYKATNWLDLLGRFGYDTYTDRRISFFPINSAENGGGGSASETYLGFNQYNVDFIGLGNVDLNSDINFSYLVGMNFAENNIDVRGGSYINFLEDIRKFSYENATTDNIKSFIETQLERTTGFYTTNTFDYKRFLFLTLGGRYEASSTTGDNKYRFYPSIELGYLFSKNLNSSILSNGKLRATYGEVAVNPAIYRTDTYYDLGTYTDGYGPAYDSGGYNGSFQRSFSQGNSDLKPEIKKEFEIGLDLGLFRRINLSATYYQNKIEGNLVTASLAPSTGFGSKYGNFADIENKGFEIEFSADVLKLNDFKWELFGNWSTNDNEVTRLDFTKSILLNGFTGSSSRAVLNNPLGVLWGGKWDRDASNNLILDANGFPMVADEGIIGDPNPDWIGSAGTAFTYKGFRLSALFAASIGGDVWDGTSGALNVFGKTWETANETFISTADAATIVNVNGTPVSALPFAQPVSSGFLVRGNIRDFGGGNVFLDQSWYSGLGGGFGPIAEQFIKSASWVKLREVGLSYKLSDTNIFGNSGIDYIELSLTGRNLWFWSEDDLGIDPESNLTGGSNGRGLQYFNHPGTKSYIVTLRIGF